MRPPSAHLPSSRRLLAAATAAAALTLGTAPVALAAPGDNGDIKVHEATTAVTDQRDQPKVCRFYLDAFNFDTLQLVNWTIEQNPPTGTALVQSGSITLANGTGVTSALTLPDGHYKLEWTFVGETGAAKQKVFDVACATSAPPPPHLPGGGPHGGVGTGGGGTSGPDTTEVLGGSALLAGAAGLWIRAMRRRSGRNAAS
ncbi:hypothetical protein ACIRVF_17195 [Kitasatospora sp. NPDC101157]|uniref:hypothetical protein n=1 Tax=Kitasatospora sp. NPDC101157 TaxID=3364098 RepID=UPI0038123B0A